jgi:hypothetical protein
MFVTPLRVTATLSQQLFQPQYRKGLGCFDSTLPLHLAFSRLFTLPG